jgi:hypothetical protein
VIEDAKPRLYHFCRSTIAPRIDTNNAKRVLANIGPDNGGRKPHCDGPPLVGGQNR